MKKKKKWKTWLSEQFRKCRENYARIPDFFKKRIVNTLLLSFLLLYGGCALGLTQKSAGFVGWTVYLTVCGIGYALYIYYLAVTKRSMRNFTLMVLREFWCKGMMGLQQSYC